MIAPMGLFLQLLIFAAHANVSRRNCMTQTILLCLLTLIASVIGTATGFGTSTVMIPVMVLFVPLPVALLFVGSRGRS
jgi:hypothetical protein